MLHGTGIFTQPFPFVHVAIFYHENVGKQKSIHGPAHLGVWSSSHASCKRSTFLGITRRRWPMRLEMSCNMLATVTTSTTHYMFGLGDLNLKLYVCIVDRAPTTRTSRTVVREFDRINAGFLTGDSTQTNTNQGVQGGRLRWS